MGLFGTVALLASACGDDTAAPSSGTATDPPQHQGEFCPAALPLASQESYGFGNSDPADSAPTLSEPREAWICEYVTSDVATPGANGAWYEWVRRGKPRKLDEAELAAFAAAVQELEPPSEPLVCTDDLGPRYLVSYASEDDLTGVVIDDYGCRRIRLTDDPHETVPGEASGAGMVTGVLSGPTELLDDLNARQ